MSFLLRVWHRFQRSRDFFEYILPYSAKDAHRGLRIWRPSFFPTEIFLLNTDRVFEIKIK
ncbi:MAG TPA: hypothetical protein DCY42_10880 [Chloroflexi bacterium]|nr:hypothetical protein [Chloroflexota bacterium]